MPFKTEDGNWRLNRGTVFGIVCSPDECRFEGDGWYYLLRWTHVPGIPEYTGRESDFCHEDSLLSL